LTLRVCHLGKYYPPARGGIEGHVQTLARAQSAAGARVRVIVVNHERGPTRREKDGLVEVVRLERLGDAAKLDLCPSLPRLLGGVEADVLHVHVPNPLMILAVLFARPRGEVVITHHSDHVRQRILRRFFRPFERPFYDRARAVLATSPLYVRASETLRSVSRKVEVVPLGIDLAPFLEPSAEHVREAEALKARFAGPLWVSIGRVVYYKGLETALSAIREVPGTLAVLGEGPDLAALRARSPERVHFAGDVPSVVPWLLAARGLFFPSNARSEAFGLVQVEAMASGCPVVNCAIPGSGVPWVSPDGETGFTVPPGDAAAFARAARRLAEDGELHARLAQAGRKRAQQEFDHRVMARRTLEVYERVLGRARVRASSGRPAGAPR
jgi:glycosyltransferase involved in cell wall biosynthesis